MEDGVSVEKRRSVRARSTDPAEQKAREEERAAKRAAAEKERADAKAAKKAAAEKERADAKAAKKAEDERAKEAKRKEDHARSKEHGPTRGTKAARRSAKRKEDYARSKEGQEYPNCKQVAGLSSSFPHERAARDSSEGPNALVRVAYRVRGRVDETVYMVRRGDGAVTRSDVHAVGVPLASRSDAVADGFWVSLRDSRHWQPTVHSCRYAPRVADDVDAPDDDAPVDVVIPDRLSSTVEIALWRWVVHRLLAAKLDANVNWSARVPRSVAAMALACLKVTK